MNADSNTANYLRRFRPMVPFLVVLGVLAGTWIFLRESRSTVTIETHPEYAGCNPRPVGPLGSKEWFIAEQEAILRQSEEILRPVIEQFELTKAFSTNGNPLPFSETKEQLAQSIKVRGIPNTNLLEVSVYHRDAQLASGIANAIVESFEAYLAQRSEDKIKRSLAELESELERQKTHLEQARQEMIELRDRGGIEDPNPNDTSTILTTGQQQTLTNKKATIDYTVAKARFLNERKILGAGELKLRSDKAIGAAELSDQLKHVKIWAPADPAQHRTHIAFDRLWERNRLLCILGLIAGLALVSLIFVERVYPAMKIRGDQVTKIGVRGDTTTYDY